MWPSPWDISALVEKINGASTAGFAGKARQQGLDAARSLQFALETPVEAFLRHGLAEV